MKKKEKGKKYADIVDEFFIREPKKTKKDCIIMIALGVVSLFMIAIIIHTIVADKSIQNIIIGSVLIYCLIFVLIVILEWFWNSKKKSWEKIKTISKYIFSPILLLFLFLRKCNFIFVKEYFIHICIIFIFASIVAYEISFHGVYSIKKIVGSGGSINYVYLFIFAMLIFAWLLFKVVFYTFVVYLKKSNDDAEQKMREYYYYQACHQIKEIIYLLSIILMLNDYINEFNNSNLWHIVNVCLIVIFAIDTMRLNWNVAIKDHSY